MTKAEKKCKDRGFHSFNLPKDNGLKISFVSDNFEEAEVTLTCVDCDAEAELIGNFELQSDFR